MKTMQQVNGMKRRVVKSGNVLLVAGRLGVRRRGVVMNGVVNT